MAKSFVAKMKLTPEQAQLFSQSVIYPDPIKPKKKLWASTSDTQMDLIKISEMLFDKKTQQEMQSHEKYLKKYNKVFAHVEELKKMKIDMDVKIKEADENGKRIDQYIKMKKALKAAAAASAADQENND